ncbi:MAG: hypothetical protein WC503_00825 [Candidatus Shapirobacteria bacterium]
MNHKINKIFVALNDTAKKRHIKIRDLQYEEISQIVKTYSASEEDFYFLWESIMKTGLVK